MTLDVMLATTAARVTKIGHLPAVEGVRYVITVQDPEFVLKPEDLGSLEREDVDLRIYHDSGLSNNRNHGLESVSGDIVMIADDDLVFYPDGLKAVIQAFEENPDLDWLTTRAEMPENRVYPPDGWKLSDTYRFYVPVSFEIAFRRSSLPAGMRFSTLAGIGAPFLNAGEDDLFFHHLRRAGLNGQFREIKAVTHLGATTDVHSAADPRFLRAKGALMYVMRGALPALVRLPLEARRSKVPTLRALGYLIQGFFYGAKHRREL